MKAISAKKIAALGVLTALLSCGKIALNVMPNVEVVTLLCAVFGYTFGMISVIPVCIFILIEIAQWGFMPWVISYVIHFNFVCLIFFLLGKFKKNNPFLSAFVALILTFLFGILTSTVDLAVGGGFEKFFFRFGIYYANGVIFYVIHCVSNLFIFLILYKPLVLLVEKLKSKIGI